MLHSVSDEGLFSTIRGVVEVVAKIPGARCSMQSDFLTDLGLSSLSLVMLMTEVCERTGFNILNFSEKDLAKVKTVADLMSLLKSKG